MPKLPAIVNSAGSPAAVTVIQSLGRHGIPIHALSNQDHAPGWYSRYTTSRVRTDLGPGGNRRSDNVHEPDSLLDAIGARGPAVVFPGTDANIRFLARHKQALLDRGLALCIPDADVLARAADKSELASFAAAHGFPVPRTQVVESHADLDAVRRLQFPVVLKGVFMKNHRFVPDAAALDEAYEAFWNRFAGKTEARRAVAQEWIPGPPERFGKLYVMCDQESRVVATHTLRRLRVQIRKDGSQGDTLAAVTERIDALSERWLPFFEALGWVGMASMECKYDPRDGQWKLIEINPRPWAIMKISVDCGVDMPMLYYRLAQGERVPAVRDFQEGRYYIRVFWGHRDWPEPMACLAMLYTGRIGLGEVLRLYGRLLVNAHRLSIDVGRLRDPLPTLACMWFYGVRDFKGWF